MTARPQILTLVLASLISTASFAQTNLTPKEQYSIDSRRAATRYADDKSLCAEETSSRARMQCLRDAKKEYNHALASAKSSMKYGGARSSRETSGAAACNGCGRVLTVNVIEKAGEGSALGMITGGVAGALLGHQVGGGTGKDIATVAGAAGGAYAGNKVEQRLKTTQVWNVAVEYDNGARANFEFAQDPGLAAGNRVKNSGNSIVRR
jgi:outer membrane lipoprotein SlyB